MSIDLTKLDGPEWLSDAEIRDVLASASAIRKWLDDVEEFASKRAMTGAPVTGTKLVAGRKSRAWFTDDEAELAKLLQGGELLMSDDQIFERKLISPAKAEKLLGKDKTLLAELIVTNEGKPTLVLDTDPRPAITADGLRKLAAKDAFASEFVE